MRRCVPFPSHPLAPTHTKRHNGLQGIGPCTATAPSYSPQATPPHTHPGTCKITPPHLPHGLTCSSPETVALPVHDSTRTGCSVTFLATPLLRPPTSAATCVPWPWQSSVDESYTEKPSATRVGRGAALLLPVLLLLGLGLGGADPGAQEL